MGAFKGSISVKRFRVDGDPPTDYKDRYIKALSSFRARGILPEDDADRALGWAVAGRVLDTDFTYDKVFWNQYIVVTFRVDSLKVPSGLLEAHYQKRETELIAERGEDNLSRHEKANLKEIVRRELRRKMLPSMRAFDVVWNLDEQRVYVWSHNTSILEEAEELFRKTFEKLLIPEDPYSTADHLGWGAVKGNPLMTVEPADWAS